MNNIILTHLFQISKQKSIQLQFGLQPNAFFNVKSKALRRGSARGDSFDSIDANGINLLLGEID